MALPPFNTERDRDAWATIRGFVFQVALTIERWLELGDDEHLELERGEDIDKVTKALAAPAPEESVRYLEQVKSLEGNVTLRAAPVIEFLAAAIEHRESNPGRALRFRFVTTSNAGIEKPSPFTPRHPALAHWAAVTSNGQLDPVVVDKILQLLREATQPTKLAEETWTRFQSFVSTASTGKFFEFMRLVDWAFGTGDFKAQASSIRTKLQQRGYAGTDEEAQDLYQRLFFFVFQHLSQSGIKELTKIDLSAQLERPPLAAQYQALFAQIAGDLTEFEARIEAVEQGLVTVRQDLTSVAQSVEMYRAEVQRITKEQGLPSTIAFGARTLAYQAPPLSSNSLRRDALVKTLLADLETATLLVLTGQTSIGKTQLARLLIDTNQTLWLNLRNKKVDESTSFFEAALSASINEHKHFIVLDDLPRLSAQNELTAHLIQLASSDLRGTIKLIATTSAPLPLKIRNDTPAGFLIERQVPPFSKEETLDMLRASKAPEQFLEAEAAQFVHETTAGHPMLVRALIQYLEKQSWSRKKEIFEAVSRKDYAKDVQKEAQQLLLRTVQDNPRKLLYRLDLVLESIREKHLQIVCSAPPPIESPFEQLDSLRGIWLQEESSDSYQLSPLLEGLGVKNLHKEEQKAVHQGLGNEIVSRHKISFFEAETALHHLTNGEIYDRAGWLYVVATASALSSPTQLAKLSLPRLWLNTHLPSGMSRAVQLHVRGIQIRVLDALHQDSAATLQQLDALISKATDKELLAVMYASMNAGPLRTEAPSRVVEKYYRLAIAASERAPSAAAETVLTEEFRTALYGMIWMNAAHVKTIDDLREWLNTVENLSSDGRKRALTFSDRKIRDESSFLLPQQFAIEEYPKPVKHRNWLGVLAAQEELEAQALKLGLEELAGFSAAARLAVIYDSTQDIERITRDAQQTLQRYGSVERVRFAIQSSFGRQLGYAGNHTEGLAQLKAALELQTGDFAIVHRLHAMIEAARLAVAVASADDALNFAKAAVQFAMEHRELPSTELVKSLGELGIITSDILSVRESYPIWAQAVDNLLLAAKNTPQWKGLFAVLGHCVGYYLTIATTNKPPDSIDNGTPYTKPEPGLFLRYQDTAATVFDLGKAGLICAQLAMYAEALGDDKDAQRWSERGVQIAEQTGNEMTRAILADNVLPYLLVTNSFTSAITGSVSAATTLLRQDQYGTDDSKLRRVATQPRSVDPEAMGRYKSLLPAFLRVAHMTVIGDLTAKTAAQEVIGVCRQFASQSTQPRPWELAASILEATFLYAASENDFTPFMKAADEVQETLFKVLALIGSSLTSDISLEQALAAQIAAFHHVISTWRITGSEIRLIIYPFVRDYWKHCFHSARMQFQAPMRVEKELAQAVQTPGIVGIRAILLCMSYGLGLSLPKDIASWLSSPT